MVHIHENKINFHLKQAIYIGEIYLHNISKFDQCTKKIWLSEVIFYMVRVLYFASFNEKKSVAEIERP